MKDHPNVRWLALVLLVIMIPTLSLADTARVTASALYLRTRPDADSPSLGMYRFNTKVTVLDSSSYKYWMRVRTPDGKTGYMYKAYMSGVVKSDTDGTGIMYVSAANGETVNLRRRASTSSNLIERLLVGTKVTVLNYGSVWSKVIYNSKTGYVLSKYLTSKKPDSLPTQGYATVTARNNQGVHMRVSASVNSKVLETLQVGTVVTVNAWGTVWSRVTYGKKEGYVMTSFLKAR